MKKLVESFNNSIEGFIYVLKTQRNMRIHFLIGLFALVLGVYMNFSFIEFVVLCVVIALVFLTEIINTSIELVIDLMKDTYHPLARMAKDVGAGAVLIAVINAILVGYIIFSRHIPFHAQDVITKVKQSPWNITLAVLVIVLVLTIMGKILFHRGTPLRGGMPSGHAALAFAIWTIITFSTVNAHITVLTLLMAILVAKSRVSLGVHTLWEVINGCALGTITTVLVFQLLKF